MDGVGVIASSLLIILLLLCYYLSTRKFNYWKNKKVPYAKPLPLFGNYANYILQKNFTAEISQKLCQQFPKEPYFGTFFGTEPALVVQDPELIKVVLVKDFYHFSSREILHYVGREMVTNNVFFHYGNKWKIVRQGVTPLFSSSKLKNMFYLIKSCANSFERMLDYETKMNDVFDAKVLMTRYIMDCVCSCCFGIDVKTMEKNSENNPFLAIGNTIFSKSLLRGYKIVGRAMWPQIFYGLGLTAFPPEVDNFFRALLTDVFKSRNYEPTKRNDFVDLFLNLKKNKYIVEESKSNMDNGSSKDAKVEITDSFLVSQCFVFFAAGFETTAGALSMTLFELAKNQEAQRRAQQEVDEYLKKHNNAVEYDCWSELPYLESCVSETLRLYPVLPLLTREVVEDYQFPSGLRVERGLRVHIPVYHLHRNPEHFPNPDEFRPERFLPGAEPPITPFTYMPFGEGPRLCVDTITQCFLSHPAPPQQLLVVRIQPALDKVVQGRKIGGAYVYTTLKPLGLRFSKMQGTPGLVTFLKKFHVTLVEGVPVTFPHNTTTMVLAPAIELPLKLTLREGWEDRVYKMQ